VTQNTSHAVMAQRHEAKDSLDHFPTPPWATRALCEWLRGWTQPENLVVWEPACGTYEMVRPLREYFAHVSASDVHPYGPHPLHDFLMPGPSPVPADWIITNPPFRLAEAFVGRALEVANVGVAMLVRTVFLEGGGRWRQLYKLHPPSDVLIFSERVPMARGKLDAKGSTATSYAWFIWTKNNADRGTRLGWLPPGTRKACERITDYRLPESVESESVEDAQAAT
jgi:hypothetical protein